MTGHVNGFGDVEKWVATSLSGPKDLIVAKVPDAAGMPELPDAVEVDEQAALAASPWLNEYVRFSKIWSPRAHDDFHESVGLWLLATVAARRIAIDLGKRRYTSLYIALAARSSVFAKSTTAEIAQAMINAAGLGFLLAPDDATPQAFVRGMTYQLPDKWSEMTPDEQAKRKDRYAFAAQKGWFFDEFGQKISAMMREGGFMADFRGLLRRFDDTPDIYEYESISRGADVVHKPYLSLLANTTPADLMPYAKRRGALWNDGFWARFAFLTPPAFAERKNGRFPDGDRRIPEALVRPLVTWHRRLGVPTVEIVERKAGDRTVLDLLVAPAQAHMAVMGQGVYDAYYAYNDALIDIISASNLTDLDGNYSRLPEKALRVAMLLASLENGNRIEMRHWWRGQQVAEVWRRNLHNLYEQVVGTAEEPRQVELEQRIMKMISEKGPLTKRELYTFIRGLDSHQSNILLDTMVKAGLLEVIKDGRAERFKIAV